MTDANSTANTHFRGKRFVCLVRQSSDTDGTTSTEAQLKWLYEEGAKRGMVAAGDDFVLNGVTGSLPGKRDDLDALFKRKRDRNDFEVLLVQRIDRATRGGGGHGMWIEHECLRAGIEVLFPGNDLPAGTRFGNVLKVINYDSAQEQARSIGERSVQGAMLAVDQGRNCVIPHTPFGCDRLYLNPDGEPLFFIRNLGDGRQQKIDAQTRELIDTYGHVGGGSIGHYRKQKAERVQLVPGDQAKADTVRLIFDHHYNQKWGGKRIADLLNTRGIKSPRGRGWSQRQVEVIYENPVYTGNALGQKVAQGIYFRHGQTQPQANDYDESLLATCISPPRQLRPPEEWRWQEQPALKDFLPVPVAAKALADIRKLLTERWERSKDPTLPKRSPSKHKASEYVLTDLLFAKQDGGSLTGVLCGEVGKKVRYYRHRRGHVGYRKGSVYNKTISAEALEKAILALIREVITNIIDLRDRILAAVQANPPSPTAAQDIERLNQELNQKKERLDLIVGNLDAETLSEAKKVIDNLHTECRDLRRQIAEQQGMLAQSQEDPAALTDSVVVAIQQWDLNFDELSPVTKRELLQAFVERIDVDLVTKDAEVRLRIPPAALETAVADMRLAPSSPSSVVCETHRLPPIRLAYAHCKYELAAIGTPVCYTCRRSDRAA